MMVDALPLRAPFSSRGRRGDGASTSSVALIIPATPAAEDIGKSLKSPARGI
jgi:hypothetical protein